MISRHRIWLFVTPLVVLASCTQILGLDYDYRGSTGTASVTTSGAGGTAGSGGQTGSTTSTTSGAGGAPKCGTFVYDPLPTCQACMEDQCCVELGGCDEGTPCATLVSCVHNCSAGDDACKLGCLNADENDHAGLGIDAYYALFECNYERCRANSACAFPICTTSFTTGERACSECVGADATCCGAVKACGVSNVCLDCLDDPASAPGCGNSGPYQAIVTCQNQTCGKECAYALCGSADFGYYQSSCNYCINQPSGCCDQFNACVADTTSTCYKCMSGTELDTCEGDSLWSAFQSCISTNCYVACSGI